jgi:hypothetical protein
LKFTAPINNDGDSNKGALEIFRLQTADSDNDIVGARLRHQSSDGLVAASQRRVRCGVCINCSQNDSGRRCLHPVQYYKLRKDESQKSAGERRKTSASNTMKEEEEELPVLDSSCWPLTDVLDVKSAPNSEPDPPNVQDIF